jgi:uncharacterized protein YjbI with pentapeptide repeats
LSETEVSTRLSEAGLVDTSSQAKASGARLIGADLRFALAERVFLALGDLRNANLLGANLRSADLRGANVSGASFTGASLYAADLRRLRASSTAMVARTMATASLGAPAEDTLFCSTTSFAAANLRYAKLDDADLRGASFDNAMLQGASLRRARLAHTSFAGADLDGADFRGAIGLTADQVLAARHREALFDESLLAELRKRDPKFLYYDVDAIEIEAASQWLSGDDEPDSLNQRDRAARNALIRRSFEQGPPGEAAPDAVQAWARGAGAVVPHGCSSAR